MFGAVWRLRISHHRYPVSDAERQCDGFAAAQFIMASNLELNPEAHGARRIRSAAEHSPEGVVLRHFSFCIDYCEWGRASKKAPPQEMNTAPRARCAVLSDVRYWHLADMTTVFDDVRFRG
jgi:hypothetical protein